MGRIRKRPVVGSEAPAEAAAADGDAPPAAAAGESSFYAVLRIYADVMETHEICRHALCRRARRCVHAPMSCYEDCVAAWRADVFPIIRKDLRKVCATAGAEKAKDDRR